MEDSLNVSDIIRRLLQVGRYQPGKMASLEAGEITALCRKSREVFLSQPMLLELEAPINICGDVHGQYHDLLRILQNGGFPPATNYLFLGDYVDRGRNSLETICLLLCYKVKYPDNFFLLRGNHESADINRMYGFYDECKKRFNVKLWKTFVDCFNCLPVAAIVEDKIFCCHGGLSPDLRSMDQIRGISRPVEVPAEGLMCDLLWSDPDSNPIAPPSWETAESRINQYTTINLVEDQCTASDFSLAEDDTLEKYNSSKSTPAVWVKATDLSNEDCSDLQDSTCSWGINERGVSFTFGPEVVAKFLSDNNLELICRAHQVVEDGYQFFAERGLVTIFSASNYCGEFDNAGAMMIVREDLLCSFEIFKPFNDKTLKSFQRSIHSRESRKSNRRVINTR